MLKGVVVTSTGLCLEDKTKVCALVQVFGGEFSTRFQHSTTHLLVQLGPTNNNNNNNHPILSPKIHKALELGQDKIKIVSPYWLLDSIASRKLLDCSKYTLSIPKSSQKIKKTLNKVVEDTKLKKERKIQETKQNDLEIENGNEKTQRKKKETRNQVKTQKVEDPENQIDKETIQILDIEKEAQLKETSKLKDHQNQNQNQNQEEIVIENQDKGIEVQIQNVTESNNLESIESESDDTIPHDLFSGYKFFIEKYEDIPEVVNISTSYILKSGGELLQSYSKECTHIVTQYMSGDVCDQVHFFLFSFFHFFFFCLNFFFNKKGNQRWKRVCNLTLDP